jgi:hypothetical protein
MVFHTQPRLVFAAFGSLLVAATVSCGPSSTPQRRTRLGEDMIVTGSSPYVRDSVVGDAIVAGGEVDFLGATGGDYLGAGGRQVIGGRIHGSLRAAGGSVDVTAAADRNFTIAGGKVVVDSSAGIGQNAYITGGDVRFDGSVRGGLVASAGIMMLNGVVGRDVEIAADALTIGPHAQIAGNLRYKVPAGKVHIDSAARIMGTVTALPVDSKWGLRRWLWLLGVLLAGAVAVALFPRFMFEASEMFSRRPLPAGLVGVAVGILAPIVMIILAITFIGLPLALLSAGVYCVLLFLGNVPAAVWLGRRLLGPRESSPRYGVVVSYLIGGVILTIVGLVPLIGSLVMLIAAVIGLGAMLLRSWASRNLQPA